MAFLTIEPNVKRMVKKYFGKLRSFHFFRRNFVLSLPGNKNARTYYQYEPGEIFKMVYGKVRKFAVKSGRQGVHGRNFIR